MRWALSLSVIATVAAIALGGCGDAPPPPPPPVDAGACGTGPGSALAGTGTTRFSPFAATGGELEIVRGAQGGIHVLVAFRPIAMDLRITVDYSLREASSEAEVAPTIARSLDPSGFTRDADGYVRLGDLLVLDWLVPRVEDFVGRAVRLRVDARSADGSHACPEALVTLVDRI